MRRALRKWLRKIHRWMAAPTPLLYPSWSRRSTETCTRTAHHALLLGLALPLLAGCQASAPACPPPTVPPALDSDSALAEVSIATRRPPPAPAQVEIRGRIVTVDQVVNGLLCQGVWSGTVYVTCDVQVLPWEELPTFLEDCDLEIAPDTVVYVAYHGDAPYYNGCSCHTGEIAVP